MKKVLVRILCLTAIMAMVLTSVASASTQVRFIKTDNGGNLNVRANPWKGDNIIDRLPYRWSVRVTEYTQNRVWAHIEADWKSGVLEGWVLSSFLVSRDPGPYKGNSGTPVPPTTDNTLENLNRAARAMRVLNEPYITVIQTKVATNYVHLRWFPDTSAVYSGAYLRNTEIEVMAVSKSWAQVRILEDGKVGFILMSCVAPVE